MTREEMIDEAVRQVRKNLGYSAVVSFRCMTNVNRLAREGEFPFTVSSIRREFRRIAARESR